VLDIGMIDPILLNFGKRKEKAMSLVEKIKLLFALRKPAGELAKEVKELKTGWKTASFWVSILGTIGTITALVVGYIPATTALIATTAITVLYNLARAIENAQMAGTTPWWQTTRFWVGVLGIVSAGLAALQQGGINPAWIEGSISFIAAVMAAAQSVGAQQPR
jgi:hypothetical protein